MVVIIFGATGLIGSSLLEACLQVPRIDAVKIFVRKPIPRVDSKLVQVITTYDTLEEVASEITGAVVFNCLGTTIKQAGSEQAQYEIDCSYPIKVAKIAAANGIKTMVSVSSVGASASGNFYLRTKMDMEQGVQQFLGQGAYFVRPSLLLGARVENRIGEKIGAFLFAIINPLLVGSFRKYRAIEARKVALAMLQIGLNCPKQQIFHYDDMLSLVEKE